MRKILFAALCLCMAATTYAQDSDSASFFRQMNADGLAQLTWARKVALASQPGTWFKQASTGHTIGWKHQGWEIGLAGGASYFDKRFAPFGEISLRNDAIPLWKKKVDIDGEVAKVPVRCWALSVDIGMMPRWYGEGTYSEGQMYLAYKTRANIECRLCQDKWSIFQLYLLVSGGYIFQRDDARVVEVEDATGISEYVVKHTGSGLTYGGGIRMVFNIKHSPVSFNIKGMAERIPVVSINKTGMDWQFSASAGVSYQLFARVKLK